VYKNEAALVEDFSNAGLSNGGIFSELESALEFAHTEGRPDIVAATKAGEVTAFEVKLTRWKDALIQAHRNTCFAHYSYVVMPASTARYAVRARYEFERRGVGLCTVEAGSAKVVIHPRRNEPLQSWLTKAALVHIEEKSGK